MARQQRNIRLQTRDARSKLEPSRNGEPYWHEVRRGLAVGYYKGARGGSWWLREYRNGRRWKRDLGSADDEVDADGKTVLSWTDVLGVALGQERPTIAAANAPDAYTLKAAMDDYWTARRAKSPMASVATDQAKARAHILPDLGRFDVNEISTAQFRTFRDKLVVPSEDPDTMRRRQDSTNRVWSILRAALNLAFDSGKANNPERWRRIRPFRNVDRARTRFLTAAEARRALNAMSADFRALARGALYTGLRLGELLALRASDVEAKRVHVRHSKSGRARSVPLGAEGAQFFEELTAGKDGQVALFVRADGQAWNRTEVSRRMAAASAAIHLSPPARFHDLRRSYASLLINAGTDPEIIKELLGHQDLRMTMRAYAHLLDKTVAKAVEKNLPSFGLERSTVRKLVP